jgi:hypothetical protein
MKSKHAAIRIPALVLLALLGIAAVPVAGLAADDDQAERESRRIEEEARRVQEQARRDMAERSRAQAEALRGQEEAIQRMEATQERMRANSQELARQSAEQARTNAYLNSTQPAPLPVAPAASSPVGQARRDPVGAINFAPLTERLKSYFGTQSGVLVVNAGGDAPFSLQDGDVIISIDGRVPVDGPHAASILRSYRPGEHVKLRVQRDRRAISLDSTAPGQPGN